MRKLVAFSFIGIIIAAFVYLIAIVVLAMSTVINAPPCDGSHTQPVCIVPTVKTVEAPKMPALPIASDVVTKLNEFREAKGLSTLINNPVLDQAAQVRAEGMCKDNDWSHNKDWEVLDKYYVHTYVGENLYYAYAQDDQAADSIHDWANSPTHLANMVGNYNETGVGVKYCPGFQNEPTAVIITNYFGVPQ